MRKSIPSGQKPNPAQRLWRRYHVGISWDLHCCPSIEALKSLAVSLSKGMKLVLVSGPQTGSN